MGAWKLTLELVQKHWGWVMPFEGQAVVVSSAAKKPFPTTVGMSLNQIDLTPHRK
jgi:hypothetical protein